VRSTNLLSWSGTKKNFRTSGRNQLSYLFTKRVFMSLLPTSYKILLSRLIPYADEIVGDHQLWIST
jgi:hypothetical protein